ncbi:MAG: hypothetical protein CBD13_001220 [Candidatus Pelagibacter sp. TMED153]|nr:MAG: hypothetical protein CBD13_001220 [Candidatus Pelagibacter sp. TMED153]
MLIFYLDYIMNNKYILLVTIFFALSNLYGNSKVTFGYIEHLEFCSDIIGDRKIEIYRPSNSPINNNTIFIFMQDGQMLFDSSVTWNQQDWNIDGIFSKRNDKNNNIVLIGVSSANKSGDGFLDNTKRYAEYFPKQSLKYFNKNFKTLIYNNFINKKRFDYLSFMVMELVPFIENKFNTSLNKNNTGILGSSMGGLLALNAIVEYPETFGFAGCFSVHWIGIKPMDFFLLPFRNKVTEDRDLVEGLKKYIDLNVNNLDDHKLYFDFGTEGLDQYYSIPQSDIDKIFIKNNINFKSLKFEGHSHEERFWSQRFESALDFLIN